MKKSIVFTTSALLTLFLFMMACSKKSQDAVVPPPTDVCATTSAKFAADVSPLMQTKCAFSSGCHGTGSINSGGVLITFAQISAKASIIKSQVAAGIMPQTGSITVAQKNAIICWVNNGALNN